MTINELVQELSRFDGNIQVGLIESDWFQSNFKPKLIHVNKKSERTKPGIDTKEVLVLR